MKSAAAAALEVDLSSGAVAACGGHSGAAVGVAAAADSSCCLQ